jgi:Predicted enzyme related to lactoylglutathione lyase
MTTGIRKAGNFCWINILTPQPAAARTFFSKLLGWTYSDMDGMGDLIGVGTRKSVDCLTSRARKRRKAPLL